jgi:hypothetical protein
MRASLFLACLALAGCTKRTTVTASAPAPLPQYEQELVGLLYGSTSYGGFTVRLEFEPSAAGLRAVLTRVDDGLVVEFDVHSEFFPFSYALPAYLVLTPREPWVWQPYAPASLAAYSPLLLDCYLYTGGGNHWPPSALDNFSQTNPIQTFLFYRID